MVGPGCRRRAAGALVGDVAGKIIADLCAALGGNAQLAQAGRASSRSTGRQPARLRDNLTRLSLEAETRWPTPPNGRAAPMPDSSTVS